MLRILFALLYPLTQLREGRKRYGATKFLTELVVLNTMTPFIILSLAMLKNTLIGNKYIGVLYVSIIAFMLLYWVDASISNNRQNIIRYIQGRPIMIIIPGIIIIFASMLILAAGVWLVASWYWN